MALPSLSVRREFSAEAINAVVNHPEVRPWIGAPGGVDIDMTPAVANTNNVLLMGNGGGVFFEWRMPGLYEAHTQFVPEGRGDNAVRVVNDALRWMFTRTDCLEVQTKVPDGNKGALGLVRAIHGELQFKRPNVWPTDDGLVGVSYYTMDIMRWARTVPGLDQTGEWFHGKLEAAKVEHGASTPIHDDDDAHDRYVGAAAEMIAAGQMAKAIGFYNKWAQFSGYAPIAVIADNPVVIDIQDALIAVRKDDFEVILCR